MTRASAGSTGDLLLSVARQVRRRFGSALAEYDITPAQSRAMRIVSDGEEPLRLSHIAERLHVAPRTATEVVDALEAHGMVERIADPTDRRATCVQPTPAGLKLRKVIDETRQRELTAFLDRLSAKDRADLHRILTELEES
jgi:DNA-binding MarR family transcriptional regulator